MADSGKIRLSQDTEICSGRGDGNKTEQVVDHSPNTGQLSSLVGG